jgi:hemerythrin-like domain-containing protein
MSEILRRIHQDHANSLRLIALLDREVECIGEDRRSDWELVQNVIRYFLSYPELGHHPLESQILAHLRTKDLAEVEPFLSLEAEHRELSATLQHVSAVTQRLVPVVRASFVDLLTGFTAGQRDHIRREEAGFLPLAGRLMNARDWQELDRAPLKIADPLSDPTDRGFEALRRLLAGEPGPQR